jgi:hypothetical protein
MIAALCNTTEQNVQFVAHPLFGAPQGHADRVFAESIPTAESAWQEGARNFQP